MSYPSLIYTDNSIIGKYSNDVSSDLKLDLFLSSESLDIMTNLVGVSCIYERQKMFSEMQNGEVLSLLQRLYQSARELREIIRAYNETESELSKNAVFVSICREYIDFCNLAVAKMPTKFGESLNNCFSALQGDGFDAFSKKTNELYAKCEEAFSIGLSVSEKECRFGGKAKQGYIEKLEKAYGVLCENESPVSIRDERYFAISDEILKCDEALCNELTKFFALNRDKVDFDIAKYENELNFYLELFALTKKLKALSYPAVFPEFCEENAIFAESAYDFSLIAKGEKHIIPNDIELSGDRKFCFLQGANGGGKTTYLRCIGVNLLLALAGARVCADNFKCRVFDGVFTHFPRDERFEAGGRLNDEENRLCDIKNAETKNNIVLLNETFSTTVENISKEKTLFLATELQEKNFVGVYVTHCEIQTETALPILCVLVDAKNQNKRTYKVALMGNATSSFATDILKKYALDTDSLRERFGEI